jgi:PBP1b-binding outer membrane lipoprotein LpoB
MKVRKMRNLTLVLSSLFLLTGCSSLSLPDQADAPACEAMSTVLATKLETLPSGGFDAVALSSSITNDVHSVAPEGFQANIQRVTDALATDPINATEVAAAASEIAIRCALVGVNLDFPNPQELLGG